MYQHVRPSHLERHLLGVFLFPAADQVLDTSYITGHLPTAALRKPGDVHSWPGNGSRLLIQPRQWRRLVRMPFVRWRDSMPHSFLDTSLTLFTQYVWVPSLRRWPLPLVWWPPPSP